MEIFDNLEQHIQNPLVLQSILSLMERGTMVLTTNYDNLLEIFGQQQSKPMESLDLKDKTKVRPAGSRAGGSHGGGGASWLGICAASEAAQASHGVMPFPSRCLLWFCCVFCPARPRGLLVWIHHSPRGK